MSPSCDSTTDRVEPDSSPGSCPRCEDLPTGPTGDRLVLAPPLGHTEGKVLHILRDAGTDPDRHHGGLVSARCDEERLRELVGRFREGLEPRERDETRAILTDDDWPEPARLLRANDWSTLAGRVEGEWLRSLLADDRLEVHFQPIVRASEPERIAGHECLLRGRNPDGRPVSPARMFEAAREGDLLFQLDRNARLAAVRGAHRTGPDGLVFINFNPTAIYDPEYCLRTTVAAVEEADLDPSRVVFEVVETDDVEDVESLLRILDYYRDEDFRVALDDLGSGYGSLNLLSRLRPDVVKLDMELIRDVDEIPYKASVAAKILELADELGAVSVAEGVETEGEWKWVRDRGADLVSGFLFEEPSASPPPATAGAVEGLLD